MSHKTGIENAADANSLADTAESDRRNDDAMITPFIDLLLIWTGALLVLGLTSVAVV